MSCKSCGLSATTAKYNKIHNCGEWEMQVPENSLCELITTNTVILQVRKKSNSCSLLYVQGISCLC